MQSDKLKRHPYLWFPDGNVVMASSLPCSTDSDTESENDKAEKVLFKVHKSVLANNSKVFADMFALPGLHGDGLETDTGITCAEDLGLGLTGSPLVTMPDSCEDLEELLMAIYKPLSIPLQRRDSDTPLLVNSLMGMLDKYQCDAIRSHIASHIAQEWPMSLSEWIDAEHEGARLMDKLTNWDGDGVCLPYSLPEPAAALRFAAKYGGVEMRRVLPAILYDLVRCSPLDNWDKQQEASTPCFERKGARWQLLHAKDYFIIGRAKARLSRFLRGPPFILSEPNNTKCTNGERDEQRIMRLRDAIQFREADDDMLYILSRHIERAGQFDLCNDCVRKVRNQLSWARETAWQIVVETANEYEI